MHLVQTQPSEERLLTDKPATEELPALPRLKRRFAALFRRRLRAHDQPVRGREGFAWCDSNERQLSFDITTCRRSWLC